MAEDAKYQVIEWQGKPARLYADGSIRNERGHMLAPLAGGAPQITPANARTMAKKRHAATAAAIRRHLIEEHNAAMPNPVTTAAAVIGESAAMLYSQIVLNSEAYPRDRLEAWEKIGKYAEALPADLRQAAADADASTAAALNAAAAGMNAETARVLVRLLSDVQRIQQAQPPAANVVDGTAEDAEPHAEPNQ